MTASISAIILAAGQSQRMGRPKLLLPWGDTTIRETVIASFAAGLARAELDQWEILVVTGSAREEVEALVADMKASYQLHTIHNPAFAESEMLGSLQAGLRALGPGAEAALVGLGDQPQVRPETIQGICRTYHRTRSLLVVPSFHRRRGHPWLASRLVWPEIIALPSSATPREFLNAHANEVEYVPADESILKDLDTPDDYRRLKP